ncbi:uncharacterized protein LOC134816672 isoform X2 [Bolinopsis microptera]|uniref:uncharacterized protein LOC134816672 isoform X2 n=1 Tax=Bolinopsis microptera TaxID=2820187 RepID=UPI00307A6E03
MTFIHDINDVAQVGSRELESLYKLLKDLGRSPMISRLQNKALVLPLSQAESSVLNMLVRETHRPDPTAYVACSFSAGAHQSNLDYLSRRIESAQNPVDPIKQAIVLTVVTETMAAAWPFYGSDSEGVDVWLGKENDYQEKKEDGEEENNQGEEADDQCAGVEVRTVVVDKKVLEELEKEVKRKSATSWIADRALKRFRGTQ